jgi:bisphosphoglycerate-dependent phosphoglycerate mutase
MTKKFKCEEEELEAELKTLTQIF